MRAARTIGAVVMALGALVAARPAQAIEPYLFSAALLGGVGGPLDAESPDPGLGNPSFQAQLGLLTAPHELLQLRVGRLAMGSKDRLGALTDPQLTFATIAGEYRFDRDYYDSGMFLGIGGYRLSGELANGSRTDDTTWGATFGVTGEVEVSKRFGLLGEFAVHYADFHEATLFGTAQAGVSIKF